jgi:hypothetical protein
MQLQLFDTISKAIFQNPTAYHLHYRNAPSAHPHSQQSSAAFSVPEYSSKDSSSSPPHRQSQPSPTFSRTRKSSFSILHALHIIDDRNMSSLRLVNLQGRRSRPSLMHGRSLVRKVMRIAWARIQTQPTCRTERVRGIADEKHVARCRPDTNPRPSYSKPMAGSSRQQTQHRVSQSPP